MQIIERPARDSAAAYAVSKALDGLDVFQAARAVSMLKAEECTTTPEGEPIVFRYWRVAVAIIENGREIARQAWQVWNEPQGIYGEW